MQINKKLKDKLWWLIIAVDYDYSRICIADHDFNSETLTLWLEDKHDFKNTLDECLEMNIPAIQFAKLIRADKLNSYNGAKMHPKKSYMYKARIEINEAIAWYQNDASLTEQQWAREAVLKQVLTQLIETETRSSEMV